MGKYICKKCGSTDITIRKWVNPNTNYISSDDIDNECWCDDCEEITEYLYIEERNESLYV